MRTERHIPASPSPINARMRRSKAETMFTTFVQRNVWSTVNFYLREKLLHQFSK